MNKKLKRLMKTPIPKMLESQKQEFFDILKESELLVPITVINNEVVSPTIIQMEQGKVIAPLFTDEDELIDDKVMAVKMQLIEIVETLEEFEADGVVINPFSENMVLISLNTLVGLFLPFEEIVEELRTLLRSNSTTLSKETELYIRSNKQLENPFSIEIPMNASSNKDFREDMEFLNIMHFSKGDKIMYVGDVVDEKTHPDVVIAPDTKFELIKSEGKIFEWKCVSQTFYDE